MNVAKTKITAILTLITINKNKRLCEKNKNLATLPDRFKNLLFVGGELRL